MSSDAFLTTVHPFLENGVIVVLKEPFLWWRSNLIAASALRDWKVATNQFTDIGGTPFEHPPYSPDLAPWLLGFSNHEKGASKQGILKWSTVCSTVSRSGWSVVRSASLAKGGASKNRPSPHLQKAPTRRNKVSLRTFQTALV
jgi:hypothetical protein